MTPVHMTIAIFVSTPAAGHSLIPSGLLALVDPAVRALLVAAVVWAGLRLLGARHVVAQKAAWGLVLAGAMLIPFVVPWAGKVAWLPPEATLVLPTHTWSQYLHSLWDSLNPAKNSLQITSPAPDAGAVSTNTSTAAPTASGSADAMTASLPVRPDADRFPDPTISKSTTSGAEASARPAPLAIHYYLPLSDALWLIYGSVCLALLLRLAYGIGAAVGLWQSAEPVQIDSWPRLPDGLRLRSSHKITSPVTVGSGIVLPADYDEWDTEKLRIVLAHERSHVRQGDFYLQALAGLYTALFWFSPLGWWLKSKLSDLSEAISDRAGLDEAASHASYAQILLEFAALPRRTQVGVAMARSGRITQRIERLLNETSFRQAFVGGRRRLWAALLMVPIALFAATALIRVQAAQVLQQPAAAQGPVIAQSHPACPRATAEPAQSEAPSQDSAIPAVGQAPAAPPAPAQPSTAPAPNAPAPADAPEATAPTPPTPPDADSDNTDIDNQDQSVTTTTNQCRDVANATNYARHAYVRSSGRGYSYAYSWNGDSYALVSGNDKRHVSFSGDWDDGRSAEIDKARSMAHGDFLWFNHNGKSYVVDDPQTISQIQAMYKPMEDLGRQQEELGRKQEELGKQQEELGRRQEQASVPTPDMSKEIADLNAAIARLQEKKNGTITMDQLGELQGKIGELEGRLGGIQGEIGARQGELGKQQGKLGEQQGRLGAEQGRLGAEQGRLARQADTKVKSIIDESLKNGKAKPIQ